MFRQFLLKIERIEVLEFCTLFGSASSAFPLTTGHATSPTKPHRLTPNHATPSFTTCYCTTIYPAPKRLRQLNGGFHKARKATCPVYFYNCSRLRLLYSNIYLILVIVDGVTTTRILFKQPPPVTWLSPISMPRMVRTLRSSTGTIGTRKRR